MGLATEAQSLVVSYRLTASDAGPGAGTGECARKRFWNRAKSNNTNMARAIWNGKVVAESNETEEVEGNVYFPESSLKREYFRPSSTTSTCPWKGQARYMSLVIDGQDNQDAAWYYPDPKPAARKIKGHVAFWRGVEVEK
jgi:uncharacterized protein (DUF427 family)